MIEMAEMEEGRLNLESISFLKERSGGFWMGPLPFSSFLKR